MQVLTAQSTNGSSTAITVTGNTTVQLDALGKSRVHVKISSDNGTTYTTAYIFQGGVNRWRIFHLNPSTNYKMILEVTDSDGTSINGFINGT